MNLELRDQLLTIIDNKNQQAFDEVIKDLDLDSINESWYMYDQDGTNEVSMTLLKWAAQESKWLYGTETLLARGANQAGLVINRAELSNEVEMPFFVKFMDIIESQNQAAFDQEITKLTDEQINSSWYMENSDKAIISKGLNDIRNGNIHNNPYEHSSEELEPGVEDNNDALGEEFTLLKFAQLYEWQHAVYVLAQHVDHPADHS